MSGWKAAPHRPLVQLEDHLWTTTALIPGPLKIPRRMVVARRSDGRLVIHSAIALEEQAMLELESLGEPAFLLVPGRYHRMDAPAFAARYPAMKVLAPRGALRAARAVVRVDGTYEDHPDDPDVAVVPELEGTGCAEGVLLVRGGGRASLAFCDAVMNLPHAQGLVGLLLRHGSGTTGGPRVSRLFRLTTVKDRAALRAHLARLADTPGLVRVLPGHGAAIEDDAAGALRRVAEGA